MDDKLTWLSPDGDPTKRHVKTLGDMISEAFYGHKRVLINARKKSSTATESSEWQTVKSVSSKDFFKKKKKRLQKSTKPGGEGAHVCVAGSHPRSNSRHAPTTGESFVEVGLGVMIPQGLVAPVLFAVKLLGIS